MFVSQPGLSAQLARLRDLFGDPLLVPSESGRGMLPTSRALESKGPLHAALKDLEMVVRHPPRFDPKVDPRTFAIAASDNATIVLGLPLMERLRDEAGSGVRIAFQAARSDVGRNTTRARRSRYSDRLRENGAACNEGPQIDR